MPRIEIIPAGWDESREKTRGDGSPCLDVCEACSCQFDEGSPVDQGEPDNLTKQFPGATIGSTDVEHPPYEDEPGQCQMCGRPLAKDDN